MQEGSSQSKFTQSLAPDRSSSRAGGIFILLSLLKSTEFLAWVSSAGSRSDGRNGLRVPVFVGCIDCTKSLWPVLVLDIGGRYDLWSRCFNIYGMWRAITRLSVTVALMSEGRLLSCLLLSPSSFWCVNDWWCLYCYMARQPTTARMFLNPRLIYSQHCVQPDDDGKLMGFALMK